MNELHATKGDLSGTTLEALSEELLELVGSVTRGEVFAVDARQHEQFVKATWLDRAYPDELSDFPETLVEGFLLLSLVDATNRFSQPPTPSSTWAVNYGLDRVRFAAAVHVGQGLIPQFEILAIERKSTGVKVLRRCTFLHAADERVAMVADWWGYVMPRGVQPESLKSND